jgi:hypothetical protein
MIREVAIGHMTSNNPVQVTQPHPSQGKRNVIPLLWQELQSHLVKDVAMVGGRGGHGLSHSYNLHNSFPLGEVIRTIAKNLDNRSGKLDF